MTRRRWSCRAAAANTPERSARGPLALISPASRAWAQDSRPRASLTQVTGSVSTTFGGVPRVCRGPAKALDRGVRRHPDLHGAAGRVGGQQAEQVGDGGPEGLPLRLRVRLERLGHREGQGPAEHRGLSRPGPGLLAQRGPLGVQGGAQSLGVGAAGGHQRLTYRDFPHHDPGHRVDARARWVTTYIMI